jgi:hypothetical protein
VLAVLGLMQMVALKGNLLSDVLTVELGLLVVLFGRRFHAAWRSHTQMIVIGLSTAAIARLSVQGVWQLIALKAAPHSQAEYDRILGLRDKLSNANAAVYVAVLLWWIVFLWNDEPGAAAALETPALETPDAVENLLPETASAIPEEVPPDAASVPAETKPESEE